MIGEPLLTELLRVLLRHAAQRQVQPTAALVGSRGL